MILDRCDTWKMEVILSTAVRAEIQHA
jgi:hypothetical protein